MILIIAEIGVNHGGSVETALQLVDAAKSAGADAVKFQMFDSRRLWGDDRIKHLELTESELRLAADYAATKGIEFLCTPFGVPEVEFLAPLVKRMKVASGCLNRPALLNAVRDTGLPIIMSTGMSTIEEVNAALGHLGYDYPARYLRDITLLHCTSAYPCHPADAQLRAMEVLRHHHGHRCGIGYSDHTEGINVAIAAAALGASVIEKHFTFDRRAEGPDHKASIEPPEFKRMVEAIREVESALGTWQKRVMPAEAELRRAWGRA